MADPASPQSMQPINREPAPPDSRAVRIALVVMHVAAPVILVGLGVLLCILGHGRYTSVFANRDSLLCTMGVGLIVIAMMLVLLNWLMRLAAESGDDRDREDEAREYFIRNGHWPRDS